MPGYAFPVTITLKNPTNTEQIVKIPRGTIIEPESGYLTYQSAVIAKDYIFTLNPKETRSVMLDAECWNEHLSPPKTTPGKLTPLKGNIQKTTNIRGQSDAEKSSVYKIIFEVPTHPFIVTFHIKAKNEIEALLCGELMCCTFVFQEKFSSHSLKNIEEADEMSREVHDFTSFLNDYHEKDKMIEICRKLLYQTKFDYLCELINLKLEQRPEIEVSKKNLPLRIETLRNYISSCSDPSSNAPIHIIDLLGEYKYSRFGDKIILYDLPIKLCVAQLHLDYEALNTIVFYHEMAHSVTHRGIDFQGNFWSNFDMASSHDKEYFAQIYAYKLLEKEKKNKYIAAMKRLAKVQHGIYQEFFDDIDKPIELINEKLYKTRKSQGMSLLDHLRTKSRGELIPEEWVTSRINVVTSQNKEKWAADFGEEVRDGDEIWSFCSPADSWKMLCGRSGYVLVRWGRIIDSHIILMN